MKFTRLVKYGAIGLTGVLALVGCSNGSTGEEVKFVTEVSEPVTIDFWHSMSGANADALNEIVNDFNESVGEEKGIYVVPTFQGNYHETKAKALASFKAGNAPDVIQGTNNDIYEYTANGFIKNLDQYIFNGEIGMYDEDSLEDIFKVYREDSKSYLEDGGYYSLPFAKSTDLLFYNKTFFEEHNLKVPQTWDEVVEVSKQITEITGQPSFSIDNTPNHLITMLKQLDGGYTNKDGELLFNNETSKEILELTRKMIQDEKSWRIAGEDVYSSLAFTNGLCHMYVGSSAGASFLHNDNFEWAAVPAPQFDLENPHYISQGNNVAVVESATSTSDEVYGSYEFVKYLVGYDANLKWSTKTGYLPVRESVANSEEYQSIMKENSDKQAAIQSVENGFIEPLFANGSLSSNIVRDKVGVMVDEIIATDVDIQSALDETERQLNSY